MNGCLQYWVAHLTGTADPNRDYWRELPLTANGTLEIRIFDLEPYEVPGHLDSVFVDQIWIRVVP